jgi:hypothetical protein
MDFSTSKESSGKLVAPDRQLMANAPGLPRTGDTPPSAVPAKPAWIRNPKYEASGFPREVLFSPDFSSFSF